MWWLALCWIREGQDLRAQGREQGPRSPEASLTRPQASPALLWCTLTFHSEALVNDTGAALAGIAPFIKKDQDKDHRKALLDRGQAS